MYVASNPKSKAALKRELAAGNYPEVYAPGFGTVPYNGPVSLEGPHSPQPHSWYGTGTMKNGLLIAVK
jgi:hypothetical protein